jgi:hypothetical protein
MQTLDLAEERQPTRRVGVGIKARAEVIEAFYAIADRKGWVLGETFERAVAALERELGVTD